MDLQNILDIIENEYLTEMEDLENILCTSLKDYSEEEVVVSKLNEQKEKLNFNYFSKKIEEENILTYEILEERFAGFNFKNKFLVHICSRKIISFASYCMGNEVKISLNFPRERESTIW